MFVIRVPALRECREDLAGFWMSILRQAQRTAEVDPDDWLALAEHPALLEVLRQHPLPGNLRDLQRLAFHGLAALESGMGLDDSVLAALQTLDRPQAQTDASTDRPLFPLPGGLDEELARIEASWLRAALEQAGNNQTEAARLLGLPRRTFVDRVARRLGGD